MSRVNRAHARLAAAATLTLAAVCAAPAWSQQPGAATPAAAAGSAPRGPDPACLAALDQLSQGIPREETGPVLRSKGLLIKTPIALPEGLTVMSAARVRAMIDNRGLVVPGSVVIQGGLGDERLAQALPEAVERSLSFNVGGAFSVPKQFPFTTVVVACP